MGEHFFADLNKDFQDENDENAVLKTFYQNSTLHISLQKSFSETEMQATGLRPSVRGLRPLKPRSRQIFRPSASIFPQFSKILCFFYYKL